MSVVHTFVKVPRHVVEELYTAIDQTIAEGNPGPLETFVGFLGLTLDELQGELGEITVDVTPKKFLRRETRRLDPPPAFVIQAVFQRLADRRMVASCDARQALSQLRAGVFRTDVSGVPGVADLFGAIDGKLQQPPKHLAATEPPSYSFIPLPKVRAVAAAAHALAQRCAPSDDELRPVLADLARLLGACRADEAIVVMAG